MKALVTAIIILCCCLLSGCSNKEYYAALNKKLDLQLKELKLELRTRKAIANTPLFKHSYVDSDGNQHEMILNRQDSDQQRKTSSIANVHIPTPEERGFSYFDRSLTTAERLLWILKGGGSGDSESYNTSYIFGDDAYFQQSFGDASPNDMQRDIIEPAPLDLEE